MVPHPCVLSIRLTPKTKADNDKMKAAFSLLMQEDPTLEIYTEDESGRTVIGGMDELHLETAVDRIKREHNVEIYADQIQVEFRETIRRQAEGECRYIHQTTGLGDYGHVLLRIEPNATGKGYEFRNDSRGGVVPNVYIKPIELGVQEAMQSGVLAGYQMVDIKVILCDGSYHDLHSNDLAFKTAGSWAFKQAALKAKPVLLQPIMLLSVTVPEGHTDMIVNDLETRNGRIVSKETLGKAHAIKAVVPLSKVLGYASAVDILTKGQAAFSMQFTKYDVRPDEGEADDGTPAIATSPKRPPLRNFRTSKPCE